MSLVEKLTLAGTWGDEDLLLKRYQRWHVAGKLPRGESSHLDVGARLVCHALTNWGDSATAQLAASEKRLVDETLRKASDSDVAQAMSIVSGARFVEHGKFSVPWTEARPKRRG